MSDFGKKLLEARKAKGYTQSALAEELHVSRQAISHWETGRSLPDLDMIGRLSVLLDLQNPLEELSSMVISQSAEADETPADEISSLETAPDAPNRLGKRLQIAIALIMMGLLVLVMGLLLFHWPKPSAVVNVWTDAPVAYLQPLGKDETENMGWDMMFYFENISDVPFTPECVVAYYYQDEEIRFSIAVPYADLLPWMGNDKLIKGNHPLKWPFATNQLYLTGMEAIIYGTDDNGHHLSFGASVQYSMENPAMDGE